MPSSKRVELIGKHVENLSVRDTSERWKPFTSDYLNQQSMSRSKPELLQVMSGITIFLLFPGFFFYHTAIAFSIVPPILGGFFGPIAIILGLPLVVAELASIGMSKTKLVKFDYLFIATVMFMACWAIIHFVFGNGAQGDVPYFYYVTSSLFFWSVLHISFRHIPISDKTFVRFLLAAWVVMLLIALLNSENQFFFAALAADEDVSVATYQGFARSALVSSMLLLSVFRGMRAAGIFLVTLIFLFVLGARSEFVGFIVAAVPVMMLRKKGWKMLLLWVPLCIGGLAYLAMSTNALEGNSRILQLFEITQAGSYISRQQMLIDAVETITSNPFSGEYASDLVFGGPGFYAHNALSAWVSYGIIGFVLFVSMICYALVLAIRMALVRGSSDNSMIAAALGFGIYAVLMAIASKPVYDPMFAVAGGMVVAALTQKREKSI